MKILVVDDHPTNRKLLRVTLEMEEHSIVEAAEGVEALAVLDREPVDAIIADILMPGMDGYRLCQEVRQTKRFRDLPFIFYTSTYTSPADEKVGLDLGGDKFLRKPASTRVLQQALQEVMASHPRGERPAFDPLGDSGRLKEYSLRVVAKLEEKNSDLTQRTEELSRSEDRFRQLSGRLMQLQDEELRRIAHELHDGTAQYLSALLMKLWLLKSSLGDSRAEAGKLCEESMALAENCAGEIRSISSLLHPPVLDLVGLTGAVQEYVRAMSHRSGVAIKFNATPDFGRLPRETEIALFRAIQESLGTLRRHSGSKAASITLFRKPGQAVLEVTDRGQGVLDQEDQQPDSPLAELSVGLAGMRERLRQLGGHLEIEIGGGSTLIRAVVPLHEPE